MRAEHDGDGSSVYTRRIQRRVWNAGPNRGRPILQRRRTCRCPSGSTSIQSHAFILLKQFSQLIQVRSGGGFVGNAASDSHLLPSPIIHTACRQNPPRKSGIQLHIISDQLDQCCPHPNHGSWKNDTQAEELTRTARTSSNSRSSQHSHIRSRSSACTLRRSESA